MSESKRVIIGSEVNDSRHLELDSLGLKITVPVSIYDANGNQISNLASGGNSTIGDGSKNVTTAGTRVALSATSVPCKKVTIQAKIANTQNIYVGGSTISSGRGAVLFPSSSILITASDLSLVYLDSDVNGEGVTYIYEN